MEPPRRPRFRIRYTLRTLLWLSLCAGTIMLICSRKHWQAWAPVRTFQARETGVSAGPSFGSAAGEVPANQKRFIPSCFDLSGFIPDSPLIYLVNAEPPEPPDPNAPLGPFGGSSRPYGVRLLDSRTGDCTATFGTGIEQVNSVELSRDGARMLAICRVTAHLWDMPAKKLVRTFAAPQVKQGDASSQLSWAFGALSPDRQRVALIDERSKLHVFHAEDGWLVADFDFTMIERELKAWWACRDAPVFSTDGSFVLARAAGFDSINGEDQNVRSLVVIFNAASGRRVKSEEYNRNRFAAAAVFEADTKALLACWFPADRHAEVVEIDCATGKRRELGWRIEKCTRGIHFLNGGKLLACRMKDSLDLYDVKTGALVYRRDERFKSSDMRWGVSQDGSKWWTLDNDSLGVWNTASGAFSKCYRAVPYQEPAAQNAFAQSPFGLPDDYEWTMTGSGRPIPLIHDRNELHFIEPIPEGVRIWERQFPDTWLGPMILPESILAVLLGGLFFWGVAARLRMAAQSSPAPWHWRILRGAATALWRVPRLAAAFAILAALFGWMLAKHWEPYEMAWEPARGSMVTCFGKLARAVEINPKGKVRILDANAQVLAEPHFDYEKYPTRSGCAWNDTGCRLMESYLLTDEKLLWDLRSGRVVQDFGKIGANRAYLVASVSEQAEKLMVEFADCCQVFDLNQLKFVARLPSGAIYDQIIPWGLILFESKKGYCLFDLLESKTVANFPNGKGFYPPRFGREDRSERVLRDDNGDLLLRYPLTAGGPPRVDRVLRKDLPDLDARIKPEAESDLLTLEEETRRVARVRDDSRCIYWTVQGQPVTLSPDRKYAFVFSPGHQLQQWRVDNGEFVRGFGRFKGDLLEAAINTSRNWLIAWDQANQLQGSDGAIRVFDIESGKAITTFANPDGLLRTAETFEGTDNLMAISVRYYDEEFGGPRSTHQLWRLARPPGPWGFLHIPWFWAAGVFVLLFVWRVLSPLSSWRAARKLSAR